MEVLLLEQLNRAASQAKSPHRGGTIILDVPNGRAVTDELGRRNILVDFRPGAGIRIAPHFYTMDSEIAHTEQQLREIGPPS